MSSRLSKFPDIFPAMADECAVAVPASGSSLGNSFLRLLTCRFKSDEQLMADLQAGEADCLTVLFERYGPLVFGIARRILRNDGEAEDTAQQVFLDVFRALRQFNPDKGSFKSWLLMFVYHRAFNARRHLRTNRFYDSDAIEELLPYEAGKLQSPALAETSIVVEHALALIQPRQRRAIELTYYEGLTANQISEVTGESIRVVRHNLYRGLAKLRLLLCNQGAPQPGLTASPNGDTK
jgi:RNA polymerase sigma-70 factor (ECF subfamily)